MRRWCAVLMVIAALPAMAQAQRAVTVRADNDAFNFWQQPWNRPDEEYTSGVRLTVELDGDAAWARAIARRLAPCAGGDRRCASHSYAFGQDIFTAVRPHGNPVASPGGRPDAGVLWFDAMSRVTGDTRSSEFGWTVGATGDLSLAEPMQRLFHGLGPYYNRPITWSNAVPTEPVVAVHWDEYRLRQSSAFAMMPHAGVSVGSLRTEGRVGIAMRAGAGLEHPWRAVARRAPWSFSLEGDATVRAVLRNEVLSGALFRTSPSVPLRRVVSDVQGGVRARYRTLEAAFVAHTTSAEYTARHRGHTWSTLEVRWYREP